MTKRKTNNAKAAVAQDLPGQAVFDFTNSPSAPAEATKPAAMPPPPGRNALPVIPVPVALPAVPAGSQRAHPPRTRRSKKDPTHPDSKRAAQCERMAKSRRKDKAEGIVRTEVKLPQDLRGRIDAEVARSGVTINEVITAALTAQFPEGPAAPAR